MKRILSLILILSTVKLVAQPTIEVNVFQALATDTSVTLGIRAKASAPVDYIGVTFYLMYQSANARPPSTALNSVLGVNDAALVTGSMWGTSTRFTNPAQVITPAFDAETAGGQTYDRRYVYGNSDESTPANTRSLTTNWDTLLYITLITLQTTNPEGGFVYMQQTSDAPGASLTDPFFANLTFTTTASNLAVAEMPVGLSVVAPVLFTKFDAGCSNNGAVVKWSTGSEFNSNYFEVQRSINGNDWTAVGTVKAAGNSSTARTYEQIDKNGGLAFYRIKQVDVDGHFIYTSIIKTSCARKSLDMVIYPVPARDILNVVINSDKALKTQLLLVNGIGQIIKRIDATLFDGSNTFLFNLKGLANGEYIIRSNAPGVELNKKFNILR